jgi:arylsulfatase
MNRHSHSKNVLLVILDSVRAQNTSLHGYKKDTTPFLRRFAKNATVYRQARAPGVNTMTSLASVFTGLQVPEHGLIHRGLQLESGHTIWEKLSNDGYQTAVFSRNTNLVELPVGLKQAFDEIYSGYSDRLPFPEATDIGEYNIASGAGLASLIADVISNGRPLRSILNSIALIANTKAFSNNILPNRISASYDDSIHTDQLLKWITEQQGSWAACINYMDAHIPYQPREEHNIFIHDSDSPDGDTGGSKWEFFSGDRRFSQLAWLERLYDGAIHQVDAEVRRLIEGLKSFDEYEDTLIVIAGDHGDAFGEKSELRDCRCVHHGITARAHETILHVPLVVKSPQQDSGRIISNITTLTNFPQAVISVIDDNQAIESFDTNESVIGYSPPINMLEMSDAGDYSIDNMSPFEKPMRVVYDHSDMTVRKYVEWNGQSKLEMVRSDSDIEDTEKDPLQKVQSEFDKVSDQNVVHAVETKLDPAVKQRLEELGYV